MARPPLPITVEPLEAYEHRGDGHTISRHCGMDPALEGDRLAQHRALRAVGSFTDVPTAQRCVEACVRANIDGIRAWRDEQRPRLAIDHDMGEVVGGVLPRSRWIAGDTAPQPATRVRVVLRRNGSYASGFAVLTAYPRLP